MSSRWEDFIRDKLSPVSVALDRLGGSSRVDPLSARMNALIQEQRSELISSAYLPNYPEPPVDSFAGSRIPWSRNNWKLSTTLGGVTDVTQGLGFGLRVYPDTSVRPTVGGFFPLTIKITLIADGSEHVIQIDDTAWYPIRAGFSRIQAIATSNNIATGVNFANNVVLVGRQQDLNMRPGTVQGASPAGAGNILGLSQFSRQEWLAAIRAGIAFAAQGSVTGAAQNVRIQLQNPIVGKAGLVYGLTATVDALAYVSLTLNETRLASPTSGTNLRTDLIDTSISTLKIATLVPYVGAGTVVAQKLLAANSSQDFGFGQGFLAELNQYTGAASNNGTISVSIPAFTGTLTATFYWIEAPSNYA